MSEKQNKRSRQAKEQRVDRAAQMRQEREAAQQRRSRVLTIGIAVLILAVVAVATFAISRANNEQAAVESGDGPTPSGVTAEGGVLYTQANAVGDGSSEAPSDGPSDGASGGTSSADPVPVVVYEDFQCPVCRSFEATAGGYLEEQVAAGAITVEYRPIAFLDARFGTSYSLNTANAAACTLDDVGVGAWKRLHDALYETQLEEGTEGPTEADLVRYALGSGAGDVATCIHDGTFDAWVTRVSEQAANDDVTGTPTVLVDGSVVEGAQPNTVPGLEQLTAAIEAAQA